MNLQNLQNLVNAIEKLSKKDHIDILRIIKETQTDLPISENSNGCFINFSCINEPVYSKLEHYVEYCQKKEHELTIQENEKLSLLNSLN